MKVRNIWTNNDFESMNWHDNYVHSIVFPGDICELILDIDYIFQWDLNKDQSTYKFWISPCILSFSNVLNLRIDLDFKNSTGLDISSIKRLNERVSPNGKTTLYDFIIETEKGLITFESTGFIQEVIQQPILSDSQLLTRQR